MSEYPINCCECHRSMGVVHATEWSDKYRCEECKLERVVQGEKGDKHEKAK